VSRGDDLSPLFAEIGFSSISATFSSDGGYLVNAAWPGDSLDFTGTWSADLSTDPHGITLLQDDPIPAEAAGIWAVDSEVLTYEIVDLNNTDGYTAPTADGGFGSTGAPGSVDADFNVQTYRRP